MGPVESGDFQSLWEQMNRGDGSARSRLVEHFYSRLCGLTGAILGTFPALDREHEAASVFHQAWMDIETALATVQPPTVADFFRLAAHKIRQRLLDLAKDHARRALFVNDANRPGAESSGTTSPGDAATSTYDPQRLALWTEFHGRVDELPDREREIFELHYYGGLTQAEVGRILGIHPREVSRRWIAATERLADAMPESAELRLA